MNEEKVRIFLTDQLVGRPNVKTMSNEIMLTVANFYKKPTRADGFREKTFGEFHKPAWDSGGFQFLMGKLRDPDPDKTVDLYKRIGVTEGDLPIQLDLPPRFDQPAETRRALIHKSAEFYWRMVKEIPFVVPVVHGWTYEELQMSLDMIDDPELLASGAYLQSGRYVLDEAGNLKKKVGCGSFFSTGGYAVDHVTSEKSCLGVGSFTGDTRPWTMGNLNPHDPIEKRIVGAGGMLQSGQNACDYIANTPARKRAKAVATPMPSLLDLKKVTPVIDIVKSVHPKCIASPYPSKADLGLKNSILTNDGMKKKGGDMVAVGSNIATSARNGVIASGTLWATSSATGANKNKPKGSKRVSLGVIIDRLATVLNMLRDRELFILGGASPHLQHMIFMGGAKYSDTSAWRLKGYFGEIYLPEIGSRSIGYKDTSTRLKESEKPLLAECLRESSHPLSGMSVDRFIEIGHMNMTEWKETWDGNEWEIKPFPLRALHNAWVLKMKEEVTAHEYANDPDRYYAYLKKRFDGRPNLTRRLEKLWAKLRRPWVQTSMGVFLKGGGKGLGLPQAK